MQNAPATPIAVNGSTLPATLSAALRYLIAMGGTLAVSKGWVDAENIEGIATIVMTVAAVAYGLWKTNSKQGELIIAAEAAPNTVAKVS